MVLRKVVEEIMQIFNLEQDASASVVELVLIDQSYAEHYISSLEIRQQKWLEEHDFKASPSQICTLVGHDGALERVLCGYDIDQEPWEFAKVIHKLPTKKVYAINTASMPGVDIEKLAYIWGCHCYQYTQYKVASHTWPYLSVANLSQAQQQKLSIALHATYKVRDLINTPAEDCGPEHLEQVVHELGSKYDASVEVIKGDELIEAGYPLIHAVGRASHREPRLIVLRWGQKDDPKIALVGKGVCFDTGGLQIKPHASMQSMKKDMGGAAHMIALAQMLMATKAPVQITLWIAAVDNAVGPNAFRPRDIFHSRKGLTVEIGHTDAEGRLCLADLLTAATSEEVDFVVDYATLTGAQRVALGMTLPAVFCNNQAMSSELQNIANQQHDPVWPLPLHNRYRPYIQSKIADLSSTGSTPYGGAITAALFLEAFLEKNTNWIHIDAGAYNTTSSPGKPEGGEAMGLIALFQYILRYYK